MIEREDNWKIQLSGLSFSWLGSLPNEFVYSFIREQISGVAVIEASTKERTLAQISATVSLAISRHLKWGVCCDLARWFATILSHHHRPRGHRAHFGLKTAHVQHVHTHKCQQRLGRGLAKSTSRRDTLLAISSSRGEKLGVSPPL